MKDLLLRIFCPGVWRERQEVLALLDDALANMPEDFVNEMEDTIHVASIPKEDRFLLHTPSKLNLPMRK